MPRPPDIPPYGQGPYAPPPIPPFVGGRPANTGPQFTGAKPGVFPVMRSGGQIPPAYRDVQRPAVTPDTAPQQQQQTGGGGPQTGPPQIAYDAQGNLTYYVNAGQTLWEISRRTGVPMEAIVAANNLAGPGLRAGTRLVLPAGEGLRVSAGGTGTATAGGVVGAGGPGAASVAPQGVDPEMYRRFQWFVDNGQPVPKYLETAGMAQPGGPGTAVFGMRGNYIDWRDPSMGGPPIPAYER